MPHIDIAARSIPYDFDRVDVSYVYVCQERTTSLNFLSRIH